MRPLKLTMQNFGPYANETVDFDAVSQEIFLITGPTGSGKTTIFDGICFALFGESSGKDRESREMKSDFADPLALMCVDLIFELRGERWHIHRVPEQQRRKARGEGSTLQKHEAALYKLRGDEEKLISASVEGVREKIGELLGLTAEQFRQIIMLPQGEFSRLLKADEKDREALLKSIFNTSRYTRLKDRAAQAYRQIQQANRGLRVAIDTEKTHFKMEAVLSTQAEERSTAWLMEQIKAQNTADQARIEELYDQEAALQAEAEAAMRLMAAGEQLNRQFERLADLEAEAAKQASQQQLMDARAEQAASAQKILDIRPLYETMTAAQAEAADDSRALEALAVKKQAINAGYQTLAKDWETVSQPAYDAATEQAELTLQQLYKLMALQQARQQAETALAQAETRCAEEEGRLKAVEAAKQTLEKLSRESIMLEKDKLTVQTALQESSHNLERLKDQRQKLTALMEEQTALEASEEALNKLREKWTAVREAAAQALAKWQAAEEIRRHYLAAELAGRLTESAPCPVCGSIHHPNPAAYPEDCPDEGTIFALREKAETLREEKTRLQAEGVKEKAYLKTQREKWQTTCTEIAGENCSLVKTLAENEAALARMTEQMRESQEKAAAIEERLAEQKKAKQAAEDGVKDQDACRAAAVKARSEADRLKGQVEELKAQEAALLTDIGEEAIKEETNTVKKTEELKMFIQKRNGYKETIREDYQRASRELAAIDADCASMAARKEASHQALADKEAAFLSALEQADVTKAAYHQFDDWDLSRLMAEQSALQAYALERTHTAAEIERLKGELKGKTPADLETDRMAKQSADQALAALRQDRSQLENRVAVNTAQLVKVTAIEAELYAGEAQESLYEDLDTTLKGKVSGRRLSFERYILSAYLQDILEAANHFLTRMSGGRFALMVSDAAQGGKGLGIAVSDAYTGTNRNAGTLSGGETFMAALAMALGLSETVQAAAGGIVLDTLFIDEGFATLDPQALDSAIECLLTLQQDGRTIGIISHVEELKERIDQKIIIAKSETGSRIICRGGKG